MTVLRTTFAPLLLLAGLALGLPACGGGDDGDDDDGVITVDGGGTIDPDSGLTPDTCDRNGITLVAQTAVRYAAVEGQSDGAVSYNGATSEAPPVDLLSIGHYFDFGATDEARSFELTGENYATCGDCVLALANCDENGCEKSFLADSGTVDVTVLGAVGEQYTATATDLHFIEVTIDGETFESTPVDGGETWCIDNVSVDATIDAE